MPASAHVEITLDAELGHATGRYVAWLRFALPEADAPEGGFRPAQADLHLDLTALRELELSRQMDEYGRSLAGMLLGSREMARAFEEARSAAEALDRDLCVSLYIGPRAPELHQVRWEVLHDPRALDRPLFTSPRLALARYVPSPGFRRVRLRPRDRLRALIAVASPNGAGLPAIDVAAEIRSARSALAEFEIALELASSGATTLDHITEGLSQADGCDVLLLVAHGAVVRGTSDDPWPRAKLWLETPEGAAQLVEGHELLRRIADLPSPPRLVILASCQSAGDGTAGTFAHALGPALAEAGIPAVLAMTGNVAVELARVFTRSFLEEVARDGRVDRAAAVARSGVHADPDWWRPVLFSSLPGARIWYHAGFEARDFGRWPAIVSDIHAGTCTPILGSGLLETVAGSFRDLARSWADAYAYPGAAHEHEDIARVAQFLSVTQSGAHTVRAFTEALRERVSRRFELEPGPAYDRDALLALIRRAGEEQRRRADDPYAVLASLDNIKVYVTTNPDDLLYEALLARGRKPRRAFCRWRPDLDLPPDDAPETGSHGPSAKEPLVYYLFGHLGDPLSIVLTVDDYLDHLLAVSRDRELIPPIVRKALTAQALLFLGFRIDDWDFRALFRLILSHEGHLYRKHANVAAQLDPNESRVAAPERAREYLDKYFQPEKISIYWSTLEAFAAELHQKLHSPASSGWRQS